MNEDAFDALADTDRRRLLLALADADDPLCVPGDLPGGDTAAVSFHHAHLPKLDEYGYVAWDRNRDTVERGPAFADLEPVLAVLRDLDGVPVR
jgi:hypothetical protein